MTTYYVAAGSVRGECGHHHRTIEAALRCVERDRAAIRSLPSSPYGAPYSDREVAAVEDGEQRALTDPEFAALYGMLDRERKV